MEKPSDKCNRCEEPNYFQLKLPPRPELRMKNFEPFCSSDLSLSLSGKERFGAKPVNVKPEPELSKEQRKSFTTKEEASGFFFTIVSAKDYLSSSSPFI